MLEKEWFLKKINFYNKLLFIFIFFVSTSIITQNCYAADSTISKIKKYLNNLDTASVNFIQISSQSIEEGVLFLNKERIRIDYLRPNNIILILDKKKAMYYNVDLQEIEYFNPKNSLAIVFYNIFFDKDIMLKSKFEENKSFSIITKKIIEKEEEIVLKLYFEKVPAILRKIEIYSNNEKISLGFSNFNYNPSFTNNFFSMANPLIN